MTYREAIREACCIFALAYRSLGDYSHAADGFCHECPNTPEGRGSTEDYRNDGKVFDYVRQAVLEKLKRDGYEVVEGFDKETGKEVFS